MHNFTGGRKILFGGGGTIVGLLVLPLHCILVKILVCMISLKSVGGGGGLSAPGAPLLPTPLLYTQPQATHVDVTQDARTRTCGEHLYSIACCTSHWHRRIKISRAGMKIPEGKISGG